jgi:hypothetical protein
MIDVAAANSLSIDLKSECKVNAFRAANVADVPRLGLSCDPVTVRKDGAIDQSPHTYPIPAR